MKVAQLRWFRIQSLHGRVWWSNPDNHWYIQREHGGNTMAARRFFRWERKLWWFLYNESGKQLAGAPTLRQLVVDYCTERLDPSRNGLP